MRICHFSNRSLKGIKINSFHPLENVKIKTKSILNLSRFAFNSNFSDNKSKSFIKGNNEIMIF